MTAIEQTGYSTNQVARLVDLPPAQVRACARAGILRAEADQQGGWRFSFQDLAVLRAYRDLLRESIPEGRARRALQRLRQLVPERPLSSLQIGARWREVLVRDGDSLWAPETGQKVFDFERSTAGAEQPGAEVTILAEPAADDTLDGLTADDWHLLGSDLEAEDRERSVIAYRRALELEPDHGDANLDFGRMVHEAGNPEQALPYYRKALAIDPADATAAFNMAVALEDLERPDEAIQAYERALEVEPASPDAHFNLSRLNERLGRKHAALRHLKSYKRLTGK